MALFLGYIPDMAILQAPFQVVNVKLYLDDYSSVPFYKHFNLTSIKYVFNFYKKEFFNFDNLLINIQCSCLHFVRLYSEKNIAEYLIRKFGKTRYYQVGSETQQIQFPVPSPRYLLVNFSSRILSRTLLYPFSTIILQLITQQIRLSDIPNILSSIDNIKSLYNGFFYNMMWKSCYLTVITIGEIIGYKLFTTKRDYELVAYVNITNLILLFSGLLYSPLKILGVFNQLQLPYNIDNFNYSNHRTFLSIFTNHFIK